MVDISGGWRLNAYRDIPIIETTFMGGKGSVSMGSLTLDNAKGQPVEAWRMVLTM